MTETPPSFRSELRETLLTVGYALAIALALRVILFQPVTIPSASMEPGVQEGDYVVVTKFDYGWGRASIPLNPPLPAGRLFGRDPQRGDVVVFRLPPNPEVDYIKRLVGLPGDRIQVTNGVLYINGNPVPKEPDGFFTSDYRADPGTDVPVFRETLPDGVSYDTLDQSPDSRGDNTREFIVPEGHYFMMGDNRDNSLDSRFDVGYVPAENLIGRASLIFFSLGNDTPFSHIWEWPANMRWDRIFKVVK